MLIEKKKKPTEAATIPLAGVAAAVGLYRTLKLPEPWAPAHGPTPLVIYGGGTAVGAFAVQLARRSNMHPLIVVAGKSTGFVRAMVDESLGDAVVDYRDGADAVTAGIKAAARGAPLLHAFDSVSEHGSTQTLGRVLAEGAVLAGVLPAAGPEGELPGAVRWKLAECGVVHEDADGDGSGKWGFAVDQERGNDFGHAMLRYMARGLAEGWFKPHPHRVVPGGLAGVQGALEQLRAGKVSAFKFVFRIADTEGAGKDKV